MSNSSNKPPTSRMPRPTSTYSSSSAQNPVLKTLGLEEEDPEDVFDIQSKEGAGAFGRVFRAAYRCNPSKLAALKVIPVALEAGQRGEDIENVRREIQFLRECDHPNVVAFYGAYYKDGALWVAMEYCGGGSVGDVSRHRHVTESEIAVIMRGALYGLAYLHARKKLHRDIKGGNILLTASGQVKIADFGVSAQLRDTMSRRGTFVGTPYWMSPEMIQDSDYDYKSDIWSLGITAIELADQKPPLFDEHPMRVLIQIPRNPSPQLKSPAAWSQQFAQFLQFCLQKDPKERPTALECLQHPFILRVEHIESAFAHPEKLRLEAKAHEVQSSPMAATTPEVTTTASATPESALGDTLVLAPRDESLSVLESPEEEEVTSVARSESHTGMTMRSEVESSAASRSGTTTHSTAEVDDDEIAEEIIRLRDDAVLVASGASSSDDEDEADACFMSELEESLLAVTFNANSQPKSGSLESKAPSSLQRLSGDELLDLSVDESMDRSSLLQQLRECSLVTPAEPQSTNQSHHPAPPTEFKLLPTKVSSPVPRKQAAGTTSAPFRSSTIDMLKPTQSVSPKRGFASTSSAASTSSSKFFGDWQNPLSDINRSSTRVNMLRSSISSSSSFMSLRMSMMMNCQDADKLGQASHDMDRRPLPCTADSISLRGSQRVNLAAMNAPWSSNSFIGTSFNEKLSSGRDKPEGSTNQGFHSAHEKHVPSSSLDKDAIESERPTQEKLEKLRKRFPMTDRQPSTSAQIILDPVQTERLFDSLGDSDEEYLLANGATELLGLSNKYDASEKSAEQIKMICALAQVEPVIENILVGLATQKTTMESHELPHHTLARAIKTALESYPEL